MCKMGLKLLLLHEVISPSKLFVLLYRYRRKGSFQIQLSYFFGFFYVLSIIVAYWFYSFWNECWSRAIKFLLIICSIWISRSWINVIQYSFVSRWTLLQVNSGEPSDTTQYYWSSDMFDAYVKQLYSYFVPVPF